MDEKKATKKDRIIEAAGKLFAEKGYEGAGIKDIARAAGVADGTIYNYFANKDALLDELVHGLIERLGARESAPLDLGKGGTGTELEERVLARMRFLHEDYERIAAVLPVALGRPELRRLLEDRFVAPVAAQIEGDLAPREASLEARILVAATLGFQVLMLLGDEKTRAAWERPESLAPVWSRIIRSAAEEA